MAGEALLKSCSGNFGLDGRNVMKFESVESFIQWQGGFFAYGTFVTIFYGIRRGTWRKRARQAEPSRESGPNSHVQKGRLPCLK